jgi:hypothetical protein
LGLEGNKVADLTKIREEQKRSFEKKELKKKSRKVRRISAKLGVISNHLGEVFQESKRLAEEGSPNVSHDLYRAKQYVQQALENIKK